MAENADLKPAYMDQERWKEISQIFGRALAMDGPARSRFLDERCGDDAFLRRELEELLVASESRDSFIDSPRLANPQASPKTPQFTEGGNIGPFEVVRQLGSGGMGEVYLARDGRLNRLVALKILPFGSQSDIAANRRFLREAQAAAALEHPNICTTHEIGEADGVSFIVMQYVDGETLAARIRSGPVAPIDAIDYAIQVADALAEAHARNIVHRDIKPANLIVSPKKQLKVLDFGLAKYLPEKGEHAESSARTMLSQPGMIMGTVSYLSPEQARGQEVDARTDLWSLGVVLYEMLFATTPFKGETAVERLAAILFQEPEQSPGVPPELAQILNKSLQKDPADRYQNAREMADDMRRLRKELEFVEHLHMHVTSGAGDHELHETLQQYLGESAVRSLRPASVVSPAPGRGPIVWLAAAVLIVFSVAGLFWWRGQRVSAAEARIKTVEELARSERNFEAYDLAVELGGILGADPRIEAIFPTISDSLSVESEPAGASVFLRRFQPDGNGLMPDRVFVGVTPVSALRVARGDYVLQIEKDGHDRFERTISGNLPRVGGSFIETPPLNIRASLSPSGTAPERMIAVAGGEYALVGWSRSTQSKIRLDDYFIDKYEVTNAEFREFIIAGGYREPAFWKHQMIRDGKVLSVTEALQLFRDRTGLPAPRSWSNQDFPEGKENHPVTDITWYEAAAFAEFRGKQLPTVFQWEKAARDGAFDPRFNAMPWGFIRQGDTTVGRANFRGPGTMPVDSNAFGMSPFGAFNLAGNVSEWNLNQSSDGYVTSGGAWNDLAYSFGDHGEYPGIYSDSRIGFRCVRNTNSERDQGAERIPPMETPEYRPASDAEFRVWLTHYQYDRKPRNAVVVESVETDVWTREKITFAGESGTIATGYLYLPKNAQRPLQVLHYVPPGDVVRGLRSLPDSVEMFAAPFVKSGRAVFAVVLRGYDDRRFADGFAMPANSTVEFRKLMVDWITDLRRGVDYLESRPDLDMNGLAFLGISNGANLGLVLTAIETRYKGAIFESAGLEREFLTRTPETSPIKLASFVNMPKLVINGRYDETFPFNSDAKPLFALLREPKKILIYDGGHIPTTEFFVPAANAWLDETLGAVKR